MATPKQPQTDVATPTRPGEGTLRKTAHASINPDLATSGGGLALESTGSCFERSPDVWERFVGMAHMGGRRCRGPRLAASVLGSASWRAGQRLRTRLCAVRYG